MTELQERYEAYKNRNLEINIERGWPSKEQLELSMPMLDTVNSGTDLCKEVDYRAYSGTAGIAPLKKIFSELLDVSDDEIYIGGTMSTTIMYDIINKAVLFGINGGAPWKDTKEVSFLCPSPGYEKHFNICKTFGIKMIPVPMDENGPDMDLVEQLVRDDDSVKGIWCVPLYSNPTGAIYSDSTIRRLASLKTKADDFIIMWDNAYIVHHLTDEEPSVLNIIRECEKQGYPDRVFEFTSTSKITFPGGGVGVCASSRENIKWLTANSLLQLKSGDKINQYRHVLFLKDADTLKAHMKKHAEIIAPKFKIADSILHEELDEDHLADWITPKGGYFINVKLNGVSAARVWELCKDAGVNFTPAGSTFPYGYDKEDAHIRIAPTYCTEDEIKTALEVFCISVRLAFEENQNPENERRNNNG